MKSLVTIGSVTVGYHDQFGYSQKRQSRIWNCMPDSFERDGMYFDNRVGVQICCPWIIRTQKPYHRVANGSVVRNKMKQNHANRAKSACVQNRLFTFAAQTICSDDKFHASSIIMENQNEFWKCCWQSIGYPVCIGIFQPPSLLIIYFNFFFNFAWLHVL